MPSLFLLLLLMLMDANFLIHQLDELDDLRLKHNTCRHGPVSQWWVSISTSTKPSRLGCSFLETLFLSLFCFPDNYFTDIILLFTLPGTARREIRKSNQWTRWRSCRCMSTRNPICSDGRWYSDRMTTVPMRETRQTFSTCSLKQGKQTETLGRWWRMMLGDL